MRVERVVSAGAARSTEQVCRRLAAFVHDVLTARGSTVAARAQARFERVYPALGMLLAKRTVGSPFLTIEAGGLTVDVGISYDPTGSDDLSLPLMDLLEPIAAEAEVQITIRATEEIGTALRELVGAASDNRVRLVLADVVASTAHHPTAPPTAADSDEDLETGAAL